MKIDFGSGFHIEADAGPRDSRFHKRIVSVKPILDTKTGNIITLSCGHRAQTFGDLAHAEGVVLCQQCRDREKV